MIIILVTTKIKRGSIMKKFLSNYKSTIILLLSIIVGAVVGLIFKEKATVLKPLGDIFLNLLLVVIVPLIFLSITTSVAKMKEPKRLGKIVGTIILIFAITSVIAVLVGFLSTYFIKLVNPEDSAKIVEVFEEGAVEEEEELSIAERTVSLLTVNDFSKLLTRDNLIALLVFSVIFGIAMNMAKEKAEPVLNFLNSANAIVNNIIKIIMYYAPIGLGCYFAAVIGELGSSIAVGYLKTFVIYFVVSIAFYIVMYTLYAFIAGGANGVKAYWKNIIPATLTSLATCSSAACIPINIEGARKIGVPEDIAETTIPLGTSFHKDGSIIGSVFKIMFLVCLFGTSLATAGEVFGVIGIALLATLLVTAVPIGGGTISEMLIITMMGYPVAALPILTIIATIIDAPATMLNVVGDSASSMLVARIVDGKDWMKNKKDLKEEKEIINV